MKSLSVFLLICLASATYAQSDSSDPQLQNHLRRSQEAASANKYDEAFKELKEANKEKNNRCDVCYLQMALLYSKAGDIQRMLESAQKALGVASSDGMRAEAHALQGQALAHFAASDPKKLQAAEQEFHTAIQLNSQAPLYHLNLGILLLKQSHDEEGSHELSQYVTLAPDGPYAETARKMIANPRRARENYAPEFQFTTLQGESLSLDALAGKTVVLDFWATWCHPCRDSVPDLKELQKKYSPGQLELISISADEDEKQWRDFIAKQQMNWPQFWDRAGDIRSAFGVHSFPTYIVINEEGVITQRIVGENPQQSVAARLKSVLASLPKLNSKN